MRKGLFGRAGIQTAEPTGTSRSGREGSRWLTAALTGIAILSAAGPRPAAAGDGIGSFVVVRSSAAGPVADGPAGRFIPVKVELANTSKQVITAYALTAEVTYVTGQQVRGEITRDMVSAVVNERMGYTPAPGVEFRAGGITTSTVQVRVPAGLGEPITISKVSVEVTMVAFGDGTAVGPEEAVARLAATRASEASEAREMAESLAGVQGAADIPAAIRELIARASDSERAAADRQQAQRRSAALRAYAAPLAEHPDQLTPYLKGWQARAEVLGEHASLHRLAADGKPEVPR